jgi:SAM-dependent methyltransferase
VGSFNYTEVWGTGGLKEKMLQIGNNNFSSHGDLSRFIQEKTAEAELLQNVIGAKAHETGVEIGSGAGVHTKYFAERSSFLYTLDVTDNFYDLFLTIAGSVPNVRRIRKDFFPLMSEIPRASVDYVFSSSVFCHLHVYDIYLYFEEIAKVLKPGGRFFVNYQNADNCEFNEFFMMFLNGYQSNGRFEPIYPSQMQFHSNDYFKQVSRKFGFSIAHERIEGTYSAFVFTRNGE